MEQPRDNYIPGTAPAAALSAPVARRQRSQWGEPAAAATASRGHPDPADPRVPLRRAAVSLPTLPPSSSSRLRSALDQIARLLDTSAPAAVHDTVIVAALHHVCAAREWWGTVAALALDTGVSIPTLATNHARLKRALAERRFDEARRLVRATVPADHPDLALLLDVLTWLHILHVFGRAPGTGTGSAAGCGPESAKPLLDHIHSARMRSTLRRLMLAPGTAPSGRDREVGLAIDALWRTAAQHAATGARPDDAPSGKREDVGQAWFDAVAPLLVAYFWDPSPAVSGNVADWLDADRRLRDARAVLNTAPPPLVLRAVHGPFPGLIRLMDVADYHGETLVVFHTDGGDRRIGLLNATQNRVVARIAVPGTKPLSTLTFLGPHGAAAEWLLAADTEVDVHAWHWPSGLRYTWRKWHRRVVHQLAGFPGRDPLHLASCSADHSIRIWSPARVPGEVSGGPTAAGFGDSTGGGGVTATSSSATGAASIHSNQPFLSFSQLLIAAQAYALRVYKGRTLTLLHTFHLDHLKLQRLPVTHLAVLTDGSDAGSAAASDPAPPPPVFSASSTKTTLSDDLGYYHYHPGRSTNSGNPAAPTSAAAAGPTLLVTAGGIQVRAFHVMSGTFTRAFPARELDLRVARPRTAGAAAGSASSTGVGGNGSASAASAPASAAASMPLALFPVGACLNASAAAGSAGGGSGAGSMSGPHVAPLDASVRPAVAPCGTWVAAPGHGADRPVLLWRVASAKLDPRGIAQAADPAVVAQSPIEGGGGGAGGTVGIGHVAWVRPRVGGGARQREPVAAAGAKLAAVVVHAPPSASSSAASGHDGGGAGSGGGTAASTGMRSTIHVWQQ
ncbi:hypothetical protein H9P43_000460 [Blastocladiella emersonii ATCC 22665]|nr:hypothetical protein H9P43_000460 [Blastocladiella emersonii ATCC 22665]